MYFLQFTPKFTLPADVLRFAMLSCCCWLAGSAMAALGQTIDAVDTAVDSSTQEAASLTVERIFASDQLRPDSTNLTWDEQGSSTIGWEKSSDEAAGIKASDDLDLVLTDGSSGVKTKLVLSVDLVPAGKAQPLAVASYQFSNDRQKLLLFTNTRKVWRDHTRGDYWVLDLKSKTLKQLGVGLPEASLMFAKFSPSGNEVAFVSHRNVYYQNIFEGNSDPIPLTTTSSADIINGTSDWVYEEELSLRDCFRWSPDGRRIAYWRFDTSGIPTFRMINNTDTLYPEFIEFKYPKVGQVNSAVSIGVVSLKDVSTTWVTIDGDPRENYLARMDWINDQSLLIQQLNRPQNRNQFLIADPSTGTSRLLFEDKDVAWVEVDDVMYWNDQRTKFTFTSERDGWRHVYWGDLKSGEVQCITPGLYDVVDLLQINSELNLAYFIASPENATQRYLYQVDLSPSSTFQAQRLTPTGQTGWHQYQISPDGKLAVHNWAKFGDPSRAQMVQLPSHKVVQSLHDNNSLRSKLAALPKCSEEFFKVEIDSDIALDAWVIKPPDFDSNKSYPVVVHVYGEPWGTTVTDNYGGSNYLWHRMLAENGYVVMSFDNRGTKVPRGRQWRKVIYGKIGIVAPKDQASAILKCLDQYSWMDPQRVGIWGWSGGGSMTLNALFKYPDLYQTGISVAPVPDQRYYDTIYQERYMGLIGDNPSGYHDGSPINFAKNLKGNLLLVHGTGDDNCHYQTTERLIDEMVAHNRQFSLMAYPNRSHSINERLGTSQHLRQMMTDFLIKNLPPGPK